jgi:glycosyltransferase involved in cell wall biosynthesis
MSVVTITLGPKEDLHRGYHGALLECPPPSIEYAVSSPTVVFDSYAQTAHFHPCEHFAVRELHYYEGHRGFIHSVHFPVANADATWILDTDSLLVPLQYGHIAVHPQVGAWAQDERGRGLVAERSANMLELIASPRCVALCFGCRGQLEQDRKRCLDLFPRTWGSLVTDIFRKAVVCYPALPPQLSSGALRLRNAQRRRGIVFAASAFEEKGGAVILELYRRLLHRKDLELCYIGPVPPREQLAYADVLSTVAYAPRVPRRLLLNILREAHILVAPSRHEALGITLVEALSCGLAVITTSGPGMENVQEVVHPGLGGFLVAKPAIQSDPPVEKVHEAVVTLLEEPTLYQGMSEYNVSLIVDGPFSIKQRDATLRAMYGLPGRQTATRTPRLLPHQPNAQAKQAVQTTRYAWQSSAVTSVVHGFIRQHFPVTKSGHLLPGLALGAGSTALGKFDIREKRLFSSIKRGVTH